jgi:hypothetical protein
MGINLFCILAVDLTLKPSMGINLFCSLEVDLTLKPSTE